MRPLWPMLLNVNYMSHLGPTAPTPRINNAVMRTLLHLVSIMVPRGLSDLSLFGPFNPALDYPREPEMQRSDNLLTNVRYISGS